MIHCSEHDIEIALIAPDQPGFDVRLRAIGDDGLAGGLPGEDKKHFELPPLFLRSAWGQVKFNPIPAATGRPLAKTQAFGIYRGHLAVSSQAADFAFETAMHLPDCADEAVRII